MSKFYIEIDPQNVSPHKLWKQIVEKEAEIRWARKETPEWKTVPVPSEKKKWSTAGVWGLVRSIIP